jgi:CheY-like chemotaxis protein
MAAGTTPKYKIIMLIDDNEIDNLINQKMIEASGIGGRILVHSGAKHAIESLRNLEKVSDKPEDLLPDLIFLDIDMPIMDGFQFLEEFDKMSDTVKNYCKVVMLTSSMNPQDLSKARKSNHVKKYINKPLGQDVLGKLDV